MEACLGLKDLTQVEGLMCQLLRAASVKAELLSQILDRGDSMS